MTAGYLVWMSINGQMFADRRPIDMPTNLVREHPVLARHPLSEEEMKLPIAILMSRYPPPPKETRQHG